MNWFLLGAGIGVPIGWMSCLMRQRWRRIRAARSRPTTWQGAYVCSRCLHIKAWRFLRAGIMTAAGKEEYPCPQCGNKANHQVTARIVAGRVELHPDDYERLGLGQIVKLVPR